MENTLQHCVGKVKSFFIHQTVLDVFVTKISVVNSCTSDTLFSTDGCFRCLLLVSKLITKGESHSSVL